MATQNPFDDKTFVKIMKGILDLVDYNKNAICSAMGLIDKKEEPIPLLYHGLCVVLYYIHGDPRKPPISKRIAKPHKARSA